MYIRKGVTILSARLSGSRKLFPKDSRCETEAFLLQIEKMGASVCGVGDVSIGLAPELKHMPRAISLAIKHPGCRKQREEKPYFPTYYFIIDRQLQTIQKALVRQLRFAGWHALAIPPDSHRFDNSFISRLYPLFPHKTAATCAGLGWVGKSGLLINNKFGPRLNWATVLTDAPLEISALPILESRCGECRRCVVSCPAGAISDMHWRRVDSYQNMIDIDKCAGQLKKNIKKFGNADCGLCIKNCP